MVTELKRALLGGALVLCLLCVDAFAQGRPSLNPKSLDSSFLGEGGSPYDFSFTRNLDDILEQGADTDLYDPLTILNLRLLREDIAPVMDPDDIDPDRTRRVSQKAFSVQSGRALSQLLQQSELKEQFLALKRSIQRFQNLLRYSVQTDGSKMLVAKEAKGRKLIELHVAFSLKKGIDPQLRIGDRFRFRYDYTYGRTMMEYGFNF